jgi:hypothetical protein
MALPVQDLASLSCEACGLYDASIRCSTHPTVKSAFVLVDESAPKRILCEKCRAIASAKALAVSMLAGWWSLRGPQLTVAAIRHNLRGGLQPLATNGQLLRALARREYENDNPDMAAMFAQAAHAVQPQRENSRLLEELHHIGHHGFKVPPSRWRFAPAATLAMLPLVILAIVIAFIPGERREVRATNVSVTVRPIVPAAAVTASVAQTGTSADDLEKSLKPDSDDGPTGQYLRARLTELRQKIPAAVRNGETITFADNAVRALRDKPAVARFIDNRPQLKTAYDALVNAIWQSTRYYHGGAPVEAVQRTAGNSLVVTTDVALEAIDAEAQGHIAQKNALNEQVQQGQTSLALMQRDLKVRGAVIGLTARAIDACLAAARN